MQGLRGSALLGTNRSSCVENRGHSTSTGASQLYTGLKRKQQQSNNQALRPPSSSLEAATAGVGGDGLRDMPGAVAGNNTPTLSAAHQQDRDSGTPAAAAAAAPEGGGSSIPEAPAADETLVLPITLPTAAAAPQAGCNDAALAAEAPGAADATTLLASMLAEASPGTKAEMLQALNTVRHL